MRLTFARVYAIASPLVPGDGDLEEAREGKDDGSPLGGRGGREVPEEGAAYSYSGGRGEGRVKGARKAWMGVW